MTISLINSLLLGVGRSLVRPVVVVDTKAAINSACYRVRTGRPGLLERAIRLRHLSLVPLLAPATCSGRSMSTFPSRRSPATGWGRKIALISIERRADLRFSRSIPSVSP
jgi:hypothetical protein